MGDARDVVVDTASKPAEPARQTRLHRTCPCGRHRMAGRGVCESCRANKSATGTAAPDATPSRSAPAPRIGYRSVVAGAAARAVSGATVGDPDDAAEHEAGRPLDAALRSTLQPLFDVDLSPVRVFPEDARLQAAGARAQTVGSDIAFAPGKYDPASPRGQALIAHELAHVVQQQGAQPDSRPAAAPRDGGPEREAGRAARRAMSNEPVGSLAGLPRQQIQYADADDEKALAAVKSKEIENVAGALGGSWSAIGRKIAQRNREIQDLLGLVNKNDADHKTAEAMESRWDAIVAARAKGISADDTPTMVARAQQAVAADAADVGTMKTKWKKTLGNAIGELRTEINRLAGRDVAYEEEKVQFARFDPMFLDADVKAALGATGLTPAELKAMLARETADFTDVSIVGLEGKTKGVHSKRPFNPAVVGIAQLKVDSIVDVRKEAKKLNIGFPAFAGKDKTKDPALIDPKTAIKSAALYVTFIGDVLKGGLPQPRPTGADFKLLVVAAYNGGPQRVIDMAKQAGLKTKYDWDAIKNQPAMGQESRLRAQMRGYVEEFKHRLTP